MEWVPEFYKKQFAWLHDDEGGHIQDSDRERAARLGGLLGDPPRRVLELGAGTGATAAAAADLGYEVVAVELLDAAVAVANQLARQPHAGSLTVLHGDFYTIEPGGSFDAVCYWDGFGIGDDADQRRLLQRIRGWLAPDGIAVIEIYTPWYWTRAAGREMTVGEARRRYDFDAAGNRMLDRWWPLADPGAAVEQSLRCYSPADLRLLLEGTGLVLQNIDPGGAIDESTGVYVDPAPLELAMSYFAVLARVPN